MHRPRGIIEALVSWQQEIRDRIAELEQRRLRLEQVRLRAGRLGGTMVA